MPCYTITPAYAGKFKFICVNKNFCHFPIARDPAATPRWWTSKDGARVLCGLHPHPETGRARVVVALPKFRGRGGRTLPRLPSRFDMDLLLRLAALTAKVQVKERHHRALKAGRAAMQRKGRRGEFTPDIGRAAYDDASFTATVEGDVGLCFESMRALILCLGRNPNTPSNIVSVRQSLQLWAALQARYREWCDRKKNDSVNKAFAPFISKLVLPQKGRGPVEVWLSGQFMGTIAQGSCYYVKMPLPLPTTSAATLNLALFLPLFSRRPGMPRTCPKNDLARLCEKLGFPGAEGAKLWSLHHRLAGHLETVNKHYPSSVKPRRRYKMEKAGDGKVRFVDLPVAVKAKTKYRTEAAPTIDMEEPADEPRDLQRQIDEQAEWVAHLEAEDASESTLKAAQNYLRLLRKKLKELLE